MLFKTVKSNSVSNLIYVPFAVAAFWMGKLLTPFNYPFQGGEAKNVLFGPLYKLTTGLPLLNVVLSAVMTILLALLIEMVISRYQFIRIRTRLPALLFVILLGGFTALHTLHPVYFAAVFMLLATYRLFSIFDESKAQSPVFDAGLLLGIGTLFYFNLFAVLPAFIAGVGVLNRESRWREYLILVIGYLLPFVFALSYYFYTDRLDFILAVFAENVASPLNHFLGDLPLQIYLGLLVFFTILASVVMAQQYDTKKVSSRKYFTVFFFIFLFTLAGFVFVPGTSREMLLLTFIPVTYLVSNFLVFVKSRFWSEFLFLFLLGFVVVMQFVA